MKNLIVKYGWDRGPKKGITQEFAFPNFPEPYDVALKIAEYIDSEEVGSAIGSAGDQQTLEEMTAQAIAEVPEFLSQFWGWYRQAEVTLRAAVKRAQDREKEPLSATEAAEDVIKAGVPTYKEAAPSLSDAERLVTDVNAKRAKAGKPELTPAELANLLEMAGITEYKSR